MQLKNYLESNQICFNYSFLGKAFQLTELAKWCQNGQRRYTGKPKHHAQETKA